LLNPHGSLIIDRDVAISYHCLLCTILPCIANLLTHTTLFLSPPQGFLPLHWAVNQDAPNIEVVRKLIKIFPAGAGMPSLSGNLPLHYCVSRARYIKAPFCNLVLLAALTLPLKLSTSFNAE
jgi:hypothetical protein